MAVKRVYVIRHGVTDWNAAERWQGFAQVPLNEEGVRQAKLLARYLRSRPITAIYSSDLLRSWDTAVELGKALGVTPQANADLREHDLGIFQAMTRQEIEAKYPHELAALHADYLDYVIPNGESRRDLQNRVYRAWETIVSEAEGPDIAIVSHGGSIKMLLLRLFEADHPDLMAVRLPNTSITTIERNGAGWRLVEIGATPHLNTSDVTDGGEVREV